MQGMLAVWIFPQMGNFWLQVMQMEDYGFGIGGLVKIIES